MPFPIAELYSDRASPSSGPKILPGIGREAWKQNDRAFRCGICTRQFTIFRRKHHCRVCGDICCRRCLGFCLVDLPSEGIDLAYTCAKCIRFHSPRHTLVEDIANLAQSFDEQFFQVPQARSLPSSPISDCYSLSSPCSVSSASSPSAQSTTGSALTPCASPHAWESEYKVIVSQYHNKKLQSVCSILGDYLECVGGAVTLIDEKFVWVLAYKGLRSRALHTDTFLAICHQAMKTTGPFSGTQKNQPAAAAPAASDTTPSSDFQFFAAAPIFHAPTNASAPIGCLVALDTKPRDDVTSRKVQKTMANLAHLVTSLLVEERNIMRIFSSGDFKIFASNAMDLVTPTKPVFFSPQSHWEASSASKRHHPRTRTNRTASSPCPRPARPRSLSTGDGGNEDQLTELPSVELFHLGRKHAQSNPEPKRQRNARPNSNRHRAELLPSMDSFMQAA